MPSPTTKPIHSRILTCLIGLGAVASQFARGQFAGHSVREAPACALNLTDRASVQAVTGHCSSTGLFTATKPTTLCDWINSPDNRFTFKFQNGADRCDVVTTAVAGASVAPTTIGIAVTVATVVVLAVIGTAVGCVLHAYKRSRNRVAPQIRGVDDTDSGREPNHSPRNGDHSAYTSFAHPTHFGSSPTGSPLGSHVSLVRLVSAPEFIDTSDPDSVSTTSNL